MHSATPPTSRGGLGQNPRHARDRAHDVHRSRALPAPYFYDVVSADGTRLRAWTNDPDCLIDGPTVVLCNGLGTSAWTAPALLDPDCGVRVVSWNHRGTGGSERPPTPTTSASTRSSRTPSR